MTRESSVGLKDLDIRIANMVATASLDQKIDLLAIMKVFMNVEYRPKRRARNHGQSGSEVSARAVKRW